MKKENKCGSIDEVLVTLANESQDNRIAILTWLDGLSSDQDIELPRASAPLAPSDTMLICRRHAEQISICLSETDKVLSSFTPMQWRAKVISLIGEIVSNTSPTVLTELPPSLRRLFIWRSPHSGSSTWQPKMGSIKQLEPNPETAYFYRLVWQHYRSDSVQITATDRVCFVIGHDYTERIGMRSGTIRHRYNGSCLTDTSGRVFRVEDQSVSRLKLDGSVAWSSKLEVNSLHQGLFSTRHHIAIPDLDAIRCLDADDGHLVWSVPGDFNITGRQKDNLVVTTNTEDFELLTVRIQTGETRRIRRCSHHLVARWWREPYGVYLLAPRDQHEATQLLYFDSQNGTSQTYTLPPCRLRDGAVNSAALTIVLENEGNQLLCEVGLTQPTIRITVLGIPHTVERLIHVQDTRIVLLTTDRHLLCIDSRTQEVCWHQCLGDTPLDRLCQSCVHENHLLVPSTPPQIVYLRTGDVIGTIDSKLYEHAIPILVSSDRLMLKDDYGYIGLFALSGFLTPATVD